MRRFSLTLIFFVVVIVALLGARYQWERTHRAGRTAVSAAQRDSLRRDSSANERDPADTMCLASRLGFPCDQH